MRFAVHQPAFIPWPGLFWKASRVDRLVLMDTVQFPRGFSWVNRNRIKGRAGATWLTIPVLKKGLGLQRIDRVKVLPEDRWRRKHLLTLEHCYGNAPYFEKSFSVLSELYAAAPERLIDWNLPLIDFIFSSFGLERNYSLLSELGLSGKGTELIARTGACLGADVFAAPVAAKSYLDERLLAERGIRVEWLRYQPPVYPQLWGDFVHDLSSLDMIFNYGPKAWDIVQRTQK